MITCRDLSFSYTKGLAILDGVSVDFDEDINIIIGPNGCGKSTLLKSLFGLLDYKGEIFWNGKNLRDYTREERAAIIAYLPQEEIRSTSLTVFETVLLGKVESLTWRIKGEELREVYDILEMMNLLELSKKKMNQLSGGQKKLVAIAQTLIRKPKLILMDEPTNNLDIQRQLELFEIIRQIKENMRIQFIIVLHDINLALSYGKKIVILDRERNCITGTPDMVIDVQCLERVYGIRSQVIKDEEGRSFIVPKSSINDINLYSMKSQ